MAFMYRAWPGEGDIELGAQIGDPVPREYALHRHRQILTVGLNGSLEGLAAGGEVPVQEDRAVITLEAQVHGACIQIHAAVVLVLLLVEAHKGSLLGVRV
jgi:hypothetical protein